MDQPSLTPPTPPSSSPPTPAGPSSETPQASHSQPAAYIPVTSSTEPAPASVSPAAVPAEPASSPSPQAAPPVSQPEAEVFTPSSPILAGLQEMTNQPFQDANTSSSAPAPRPVSPPPVTPPPEVPAEPPQAAVEPEPASNSPSPRSGKFSLSPKLLFVGGVLLALLISGGLALWWFSAQQAKPAPNAGGVPVATTQLTYWGLWEPPEVMEPVIQEYERLHPEIDIIYQQQNRQQYRPRLQAAVKDGSGPDIFRYHNTWLPMIQDDLAPAPRSTFPASELQQNFYPVMAQELVQNNQALGAPLMFEGLALVYNEAMLEAANALPPKDWRGVRELASLLAISTGGRLERGGVALGTAENVDNYSDVLALMMLQNGATPGSPLSQNAQTALEFYTLFSRVDQVWNNTMPQSTVAFANEQVAMIFIPSWRIHEIRRLNPNLRFGVTRLPQLSDEKITWASYWVEGVSKNSKNTDKAWEFLAWMTQPEQLRRLHSEATKYRGFGELYPRVEMAKELSSDPIVSPYLEDALYARSWPLASMTHDEGLNDQLIQYYTDAVNSMNRSGNAESALEQIFPGIQQVLSRFRIPVEGPAGVPAGPAISRS